MEYCTRYCLIFLGGFTERLHLNDVLEAIKDALAEEDDLILVGFGSFKVSIHKARTIRTVHGRMVDIPDQRVVRFWVGDKLKRKVASKPPK